MATYILRFFECSIWRVPKKNKYTDRINNGIDASCSLYIAVIIISNTKIIPYDSIFLNTRITSLFQYSEFYFAISNNFLPLMLIFARSR